MAPNRRRARWFFFAQHGEFQCVSFQRQNKPRFQAAHLTATAAVAGASGAGAGVGTTTLGAFPGVTARTRVVPFPVLVQKAVAVVHTAARAGVPGGTKTNCVEKRAGLVFLLVMPALKHMT